MNYNLIFLASVFIINLITFSLYGIDKSKARKNKWRISEKTLILWAFCFGGIGAAAGMNIFRHKTKHTKFLICIPLAVILNIIFSVLLFIDVFPKL